MCNVYSENEFISYELHFGLRLASPSIKWSFTPLSPVMSRSKWVAEVEDVLKSLSRWVRWRRVLGQLILTRRAKLTHSVLLCLSSWSAPTTMDPSIFLQYSPPSGLPQESKLATYMVCKLANSYLFFQKISWFLTLFFFVEPFHFHPNTVSEPSPGQTQLGVITHFY